MKTTILITMLVLGSLFYACQNNDNPLTQSTSDPRDSLIGLFNNGIEFMKEFIPDNQITFRDSAISEFHVARHFYFNGSLFTTEIFCSSHCDTKVFAYIGTSFEGYKFFCIKKCGWGGCPARWYLIKDNSISEIPAQVFDTRDPGHAKLTVTGNFIMKSSEVSELSEFFGYFWFDPRTGQTFYAKQNCRSGCYWY